MFFLNHQKDTPLFQELIRESVITGVLWESLGVPSEGHLLDVLVGHRARIAEKPWIDWLVRKHSCTRIPSLEPDYEFIKAVDRALLSECLKTDCYPLRLGTNHLYVGIGRPDYPEQAAKLQAFYHKKLIYRNALSLVEISTLRNLCKEALQTM